MQAKSVLFGFGMGLVLLSAAILVAYRYEERQAGQISEYEILAQAAEYGMVWPTEDVAEIVRKALEIGMVFGDGASEPAVAENE